MPVVYYTIATLYVMGGLLLLVGLIILAMYLFDRKRYMLTLLVLFMGLMSLVLNYNMEDDAAQWLKERLGIPCYKSQVCVERP